MTTLPFRRPPANPSPTGYFVLARFKTGELRTSVEFPDYATACMFRGMCRLNPGIASAEVVRRLPRGRKKGRGA